MAYADRMRHLSDSIHVEERKMDVEQQEVIRQKEAEITSRRHSLAIHRIIILSAIIIILLVGYLLVRAWKYNKELEAKNRSLYRLFDEAYSMSPSDYLLTAATTGRLPQHSTLRGFPYLSIREGIEIYSSTTAQ
ncbi:MAG: hypothetical protein K6E44_03925 [Bacteroidales bacterium]|nr:hypothetical protein [Bacteroidales bacterium]